MKHPVYGKYIRRSTICHAHDEENVSQLGDTVQIIETSPRSKLKRWRLMSVVKKSQAVDLKDLERGLEGAD